MTRILIISLFSLITAFSFSQLSLSLGVAKRNEDVRIGDGKTLFDQLFMTSNDERFRQDYYTASCNYQKDHFLLVGELGFTTSSFHEEVKRSYATGKLDHHTVYSYTYNYDISYSYLNVKVAPKYVFFPDKKLNVALGGSVQFEFLTNENEKNHQTSYDAITTYQTYDGTSFYWVTTTNSDYSEKEFDAYDISPLLITYGLNCTPRIVLSDFILEFPISAGASIARRSIAKIDEEPNQGTFIYTQVGFKLGYTIKNFVIEGKE